MNRDCKRVLAELTKALNTTAGLASSLGMAESAVRIAIRWLEGALLIERDQRLFNENTGRKLWRYRVRVVEPQIEVVQNKQTWYIPLFGCKL